MAPASTALTTMSESEPQYALDREQNLKAARALLKHMKTASKEQSEAAGKRNLLAADSDDEDAEGDQTPVWLTLTTKKHITDKTRFKPGKIALPHPMNMSPNLTICLITADPQRAFKDIIASPAFPQELGKRITRVIGVQKLKAKYHQYEAQRQLLGEHDLFLADDRIVTMLPKILGKTFFKSSAKRPIPISLQAPAPRSEGKKIARAKSDKTEDANALPPKEMAAEIEKTLSAALINLSPSTQTSVRIGFAGWDAAKIVANLEAVASQLIEKYTPQKWANVRAIHIKGPTTAALPIWLASELWVDEADIVEDEEEVKEEPKAIEAGSKKRKTGGEGKEATKKQKKALPESNDNVLDKEIARRKAHLKKQKAAALAEVEA